MSRVSRLQRIQPSVSKVTDGMFLGDCDAAVSVALLQENNITAMVSLSDAQDIIRILVPKERHLFIPCLDSSTQDLLVHMTEICDFIDRILAMAPILKPILPEVILDHLNPAYDVDPSIALSPRVLVHCQMGISRSATAVIAYLMRKTGRSLDDVLQEVKEKRTIKPNPDFMSSSGCGARSDTRSMRTARPRSSRSRTVCT